MAEEQDGKQWKEVTHDIPKRVLFPVYDTIMMKHHINGPSTA